MATAFLEELRDALFPPRCHVCGGFAADGSECELHRLPERPAGPRCGRCAVALPPALPDGAPCRGCRLRVPAYRGVAALGDYRADPGIADWVLALKHGGRRDLAPRLARALAARLEADPRGARWRRVLVPVPLHPLRRLERGFDQAALLAREVAGTTGLPFLPLLARRRRTVPQGAAGAVSRSANVQGAFRARPGPWGAFGAGGAGGAGAAGARPGGVASALEGADAWLVDDVMTSGATAEACVGALRELGARAVYVLVVARAGGRA